MATSSPSAFGATVPHPPHEKKMTDKEVRDKAAREIYTTEKSYVESLEHLVKFYLKPLRNSTLISKKKVAFIFGNVEHILIINKELLDALEKRMQQWEENQNLGDVMNKLIPWLRLYSEYCSNYHNVTALLMKLMEKASIMEWLNKTKDDNNILDLSSLLIMPIQRIPRYKLLLEQVLKYTPNTHPDHAQLTHALEKVNEVAVLVNESVRKKQNLEAIVELEKKLSGKYPKNLAQMGRVLVHEGELTKLCRKVPKKRYVFLFNDLLLYGESTKFGHYTIHRSINLYHGRMEPVDDSPKAKNALQVVSKEKSFLVWADTPEEKAVWVDKIEQAKKLRLNNYIREEHPDLEADFEAPIWQNDQDSNVCMLCAVNFTTLRRKHHCRKCGSLVCGKCSEHKFELPSVGKERVCDDCWEQLSGNLTKRKTMRAKMQGSGAHGAQANGNGVEKDDSDEDMKLHGSGPGSKEMPSLSPSRIVAADPTLRKKPLPTPKPDSVSSAGGLLAPPSPDQGALNSSYGSNGMTSMRGVRKHAIPSKALPPPPSGGAPSPHTDSDGPQSPPIPAKPKPTLRLPPASEYNTGASPRTNIRPVSPRSVPPSTVDDDEDAPPSRPPPRVGGGTMVNKRPPPAPPSQSNAPPKSFSVPDRPPPRPQGLEPPARTPPTPPKGNGT